MRPGPAHREIFVSDHHRVYLDAARLTALVVDAHGGPWFSLRLLHSVDATDGVDETLGVGDVSVTQHPGATIVTVRATSSRWHDRWTELRCEADGFALTGGIRGRGSVLAVHAFGGRRAPQGFLPSGSALRSAVSPNPDHPRRLVRDAVEPATISVTGSGAEPGVGRWLFSPAPWCLAVSRGERRGDQDPPDGEWAWLGLVAPIEQQTFTAMHYLPGPEGFSVRLDYEGHTSVDGEFTLPRLEIRFGADDPYRAVADHCGRVRAENGATVQAGAGVPTPAWWREPMFCGWGAQRALAEHDPDGDRRAPTRCTQQNYDAFLAALAGAGVVPGTVVVDDKWAQDYATCTPDTRRWPDLAGWIADRHAKQQRVLLWWKAWDPEGAPPEACVRMPDGTPVAIDPDSTTGAELVRAAVTRMLAADALDADGLKIDFTAAGPTGAALTSTGPHWGAALLHRLLTLAYRAAKSAKPDCLVITHTPNPAFADVTDMIRLNDIMMLDSADPSVDVTAHMAYRAAVVRAAMPTIPIDTDGWCLPDRAAWRSYLLAQPDLGVPALYYATGFDQTDEALTGDDYRLLRQVWRRYRAAIGSSFPRPETSP